MFFSANYYLNMNERTIEQLVLVLHLDCLKSLRYFQDVSLLLLSLRQHSIVLAFQLSDFFLALLDFRFVPDFDQGRELLVQLNILKTWVNLRRIRVFTRNQSISCLEKLVLVVDSLMALLDSVFADRAGTRYGFRLVYGLEHPAKASGRITRQKAELLLIQIKKFGLPTTEARLFVKPFEDLS